MPVEERDKALFVFRLTNWSHLPLESKICRFLQMCKSLLSRLQFYYFLHNYGVLPCSEQSPVHKYCTSNYKDAWRRAEPDKMGLSQAAYDSPRQKLARSPRGRSSDAAKHDTVVFFLPFFLELAVAAQLLADMKRSRRRSSSEKLRPAAPSASTILIFHHPVCFLSLSLFIFTLYFLSLLLHSLVLLPLLLICGPFFSFSLAPTHSSPPTSSYTCPLCSLLFTSSYTCFFFLLFYLSFPSSPLAAAGSLAKYF